MKVKFKKRYVFIIIAVIIVLLIVVGIGSGTAAIQVGTAKVTRSDIESTVSISGIVREIDKYSVFPDASVKVKKVLVDKNETVKKGQKIVDLDLDSLTSSLKSLKLNKEISELNYEKLCQANENGALSLISTENSAQTAKDAYDRANALYEVGAISKVEFDSAKSAYENAKAGLDMARLSNTNDLEIMKKQIEISSIQISDLEKQISKLKNSMISPCNGVVSTLNVIDGGFATSGMAMYEVVNNDEVEIVCNVKEFTVKNLKVDQDVYITGDAFEGKTYNGYIKSIAPIAEKVAGANGLQTVVEVIIGVNDKETELKSGLNITADIIISKSEDALIIPITGFKEDKDGNTSVFVVENNILKSVPVEIGISSEDGIEVKSGVEEGQKIVENVKSSYADGMKVIER